MISIILPIRNEANFIKNSLESILLQDYPKDQMEILVVDGMSNDKTRDIIRSYQQTHSQIHILDNIEKIVPTGMNRALRQARGDIIIRIDGHCIIAPDYVSRCVDHLSTDHIDGVGGPMETIGENHLSDTIALAMSSPFGVGNSKFRTTTNKTMLVDTIPFPAYTRAIFEKAGFYDEELVRNQDDEYNYRIRELGGKLLLANDIRSKYYSRGSLQKLWKQYLQYGFYKIRVLQKHPRQMSPRQFIPPLLVFSLLISTLLTLTTTWGKWLFFLITGSYLIANIAASIVTTSRKGWGHIILLPIAFLIIHLSYGIGFLSGFIKFWNRWGDRKGLVPDWQENQ